MTSPSEREQEDLIAHAPNRGHAAEPTNPRSTGGKMEHINKALGRPGNQTPGSQGSRPRVDGEGEKGR